MADWKMNIDIKSAIDMLYLCACALKNEKPLPEKSTELDLNAILSISKFHSLTALTAEGLKLAGIGNIPEFEKAQMMSLRKTILFDVERKRLTDFMDKNGIWYMPLKGVILKDMYPRPGLRQMADNDILFDRNYRQVLYDWFIGEGYEVEVFGESNHDVYQKPPVYNYEMHVSLYGDAHNPIFKKYYSNIKERLIRDDTHTYGYHFTDEDFYIYFLTHGFKHFDAGGTGIRFLTDLYVYLNHKQAAMNSEYIDQELTKFGLLEFEHECRELCDLIFDDIHAFDLDALSETQREMLIFFLTSGTYGTITHRIDSGKRKSGNIGYIIKRLFPGRQILKIYHPMFNCILLVPLGWVWRWIKQLSKHPKKVMRELKLLLKK